MEIIIMCHVQTYLFHFLTIKYIFYRFVQTILSKKPEVICVALYRTVMPFKLAIRIIIKIPKG